MKILPFILLYALADLFPCQAWGRNALRDIRRWFPTLLNVLALAVVLITVLVLVGIMTGADRIMKARVTENPRIRCVEAYYASKGAGMRPIDTVMLDRLRSAVVREGAGGEPSATGVYGWKDVALRFFRADGELDAGYSDGRTVAPGDELVEMLTYRRAPDPGEPGRHRAGLILSSRLLEDLGYTNEPPASLFIEYNQRRCRVDLLGVAERLWYGDFLMPEGFWEDYKNLAWDPEPRYARFAVGPFAAGAADGLVSDILEAYGSTSFDLAPVVRDDRGVWLRFDVADRRGWAGAYLETSFLPGLLEMVPPEARVAGHAPILEPGRPLAAERAAEVVPQPVQYTSVSVFLRHIDDVLPMVAFLHRQGLACDSRILDDIEWARQLGTFSRGISWTVIGVVSLLAAANIYLSFTQKVQRKIPEIGILKAFGTGAGTVLAIQLTEAFLLWLLALPIGLGVAWWAGARAEAFLSQTFRLAEETKIFVLPGAGVAWAAAGALGMCLAASGLASVLAALKKPADALRHSE